MSGWVIAIACVLATGHYLCRELSEHSMHNKWPEHYGRWWNSDTGWINKHHWGENLPGWVFGDLLVFLTDAEHFFQWLANLFMIGLLITAILFPTWWLLACVAAGMVLTGIIKTFTPLQ